MQVKCETCGKGFEFRKGRNKRFCSRKCFHDSMGKVCHCENCGKEFKVKKRDKGIFCSRECYYSSKGIKVCCEWCRKVFKVRPRLVGKTRFCSSECRAYSVGQHLNAHGVMVKKCSRCEKEKPVGDFYETKRLKSGLDSWCKHCSSEASSVRQKTEKAKEYRHKYNRTITRRYNGAKASAKRRSFLWKLTRDQYESVIQNPCHYCGKSLDPAGSGLDRKDNDLVYNIDTVVSCCGRCNTTFMDNYSYQEKMVLGEAIRKIDFLRVLDHHECVI